MHVEDDPHRWICQQVSNLDGSRCAKPLEQHLSQRQRNDSRRCVEVGATLERHSVAVFCLGQIATSPEDVAPQLVGLGAFQGVWVFVDDPLKKCVG